MHRKAARKQPLDPKSAGYHVRHNYSRLIPLSSPPNLRQDIRKCLGIYDVRRHMGAFMSEGQKAWWGRRRRQGMFRFVLLYGVLGWGGLMAAVWMTQMSIFTNWEYFTRTFLAQPVVFVLAVVFVGLMCGFLLWHFNEILYKQALEDEANDQ